MYRARKIKRNILKMDVTDAVGNNIATELGNLEITHFLGKGKSGYSYLALCEKEKCVVKLMHDEPCAYYSFGNTNKVELEVSAYKSLERSGIPIPKLLDINIEGNYLVKEYIDGSLVTDLVIQDVLPDTCIAQVCHMSMLLKELGLNIDYFPDNFVLNNDTLYYVDYEVNSYDESWDLANWGLYYWANSKGMKAYKESQDPKYINEPPNSGVPIKHPFKDKVDSWLIEYIFKGDSVVSR